MLVVKLHSATGFVNRRLSRCWWTMGSQASPRTMPAHLQAARTHLTIKMTFMSATHHYMNGVTETSVGHGPTGVDEAYLSERTIVTRGPAGSCVISITAVVAVVKKMTVTTHKNTHKNTNTQRHTQRHTETHRDTQRHTHRHTETHRDTHRHTQTHTDKLTSCPGPLPGPPFSRPSKISLLFFPFPSFWNFSKFPSFCVEFCW